MEKRAVIIVAGGLGTRFQSTLPKPLVRLKGKPIISYSLKVFEQSKLIDQVIIVAHGDYLNHFEKIAKHYSKVTTIVAGGKTRADSVKCGLTALGPTIDTVLVHDAARPFVNEAMIKGLMDALKKDSAAIIAVPVKATIKQVNMKTLTVKATPNRAEMWEVQTPQAFKRQILEKAHAKPFKGEATDDAMLVENLGLSVKVVAGTYQNIKITTPEDLKIGEIFSRLKMVKYE